MHSKGCFTITYSITHEYLSKQLLLYAWLSILYTQYQASSNIHVYNKHTVISIFNLSGVHKITDNPAYGMLTLSGMNNIQTIIIICE